MDRLLPITRWHRRPTTGIDNIAHDTGRHHDFGCYHLDTTIDIGAHRLDNDSFLTRNLGARIDNDVNNSGCG